MVISSCHCQDSLIQKRHIEQLCVWHPLDLFQHRGIQQKTGRYWLGNSVDFGLLIELCNGLDDNCVWSSLL